MKPATVIKIGGGLISGLETFWPALRELQRTRSIVLVHGGGPQATAMARRLGHEPTIVHGRRVTSDLDLDIVRWTMRGEINLALSAAAQASGIPAVGLSGADAGILRVRKRPPWTVDGREVDFGWVGDVVKVNPEFLRVSIEEGFVPILAPIGLDTEGQVYNVNADTVASAIAQSLPAHELLLVTDSGCLREGPAGVRIPTCNRTRFEEGVARGWIQAGMRVKVHIGLETLEGGVDEVWVVGPDDVAAREQATRIIP